MSRQKRHSLKHLLWRGGVAAVGNAMMFTGFYPLVPHALRAVQNLDAGKQPVRAALSEWAASAAISALRPTGFFRLPGANVVGPRPVIVLHGYAMNRANFVPLAFRLARAGIGPILGFEYWTLGRTAAAARQLGWFIDQVREETGAREVDLIGHSMGGVVSRYYVSLAGGDPFVHRLITIGSPHRGTDLSAIGIGHANRELYIGSKLLARLEHAPPPEHAKLTVITSRADALVPGARQRPIAGAEHIEYDDLGHVALLGSKRVARDIIDRLR